MNKAFYGHTSSVNGLLNLDHSDAHNIDAKRCKIDNDSATDLWHCRLSHIGALFKISSDIPINRPIYRLPLSGR